MVVGLVVAAGLLAVGPARRLLSGCAFAGNRCIRVLFIGNSYTSVNDLPATFAELAGSGGVAVEVDAIDPGGQTLAGHAAAPDVLAAITGRRWTTVVLQEQSEIPAATDLFDRETVPAATTLVAAIRKAGAEPVLFDTWAHRDGWPERLLDRAAMQTAIDGSYARLAATLHVRLVAVGPAWARATAMAPAVVLWQADGSHPTIAGTYLAACMFYGTLIDRSPVGLGPTSGLDPIVAAALQAVTAASIP